MVSDPTANQIGVLKVSHSIGSAQMIMRLLKGSYRKMNDSDTVTFITSDELYSAYQGKQGGSYRRGVCSGISAR